MLFIPFVTTFLTLEQFVGNGAGIANDKEVAASDGRLHDVLLRWQDDVAGDIPIIQGVAVVAEIINEIAVGSEVATKDIFPIVGNDLWHLEGDIVTYVLTTILTIQFQLVAHNNSVFIASAAGEVEVEHRVAHGLVGLIVVPTLESSRTGRTVCIGDHTGRHIKHARALRLEIVGDGVSTRLLHQLPSIGILGPAAFVALDKTSHRVGGSLVRLLDKPRALGEHLVIGIVFRLGDGDEVEPEIAVCLNACTIIRKDSCMVSTMQIHAVTTLSSIIRSLNDGKSIAFLAGDILNTEMNSFLRVVRHVKTIAV